MTTENYEDYYIVSKTKTILSNNKTIQWWIVEAKGYTDSLKEAGVFSKKLAQEYTEQFNSNIKKTKSFAIPVQIAKNIFNKDIIDYDDASIEQFNNVKANIIGDLDWDLPEIMF